MYFNDNTIIIVGGSLDTNGRQGLYFSEADSTGTIKWTSFIYEQNKIYYGSLPGGLIKADDLHFVVCGTIASPDTIGGKVEWPYKPYLIKFNIYGDTVWQRVYLEHGTSRRFISMDRANDGGFIITGYKAHGPVKYNSLGSIQYRDHSAWLVKVDSSGNMEWERNHFTNSDYTGSNIHPTSVLAAPGGNYIVFGHRWYAPLEFNPFIFKTDSTGQQIMWDKKIGSGLVDPGKSRSITCRDGNFAFIGCYTGWMEQIGHPNQNNHAPRDVEIYYGKFTGNGDTLWTKRYHIPTTGEFMHWGLDIKEYPNGDLALLGIKFDTVMMAIVIRTDSIGEIRWSREYLFYDHFSVSHWPNSMDITPDGGVVFTGEISSSFYYPPIVDTVGQFTWLVRTDSMGCVTPGCDSNDPTGLQVIPIMPPGSKFRLYPNPATHSATLGLAPGTVADEVRVFDMAGRVVIQLPLQAGSPLTPLPVAGMPGGLYLVELRYRGERLGVEKLVLGR